MKNIYATHTILHAHVKVGFIVIIANILICVYQSRTLISNKKMVTKEEVLSVVGQDKASLFDHFFSRFQPIIIGNQTHYPDAAVEYFLRLHLKTNIPSLDR
jgi:hypothetical protein